MNKALRVLLTLGIAPFIPWLVYAAAFAGMNLPRILAGEEAVYIVSSSAVWGFSLFSVMTALVAVLNWAISRPKPLL